MDMRVTVAGAGPAGASAAIAAALGGAEVTLYDRSKFPRHKVCGEFLSPELLGPLERLGVLPRVYAAGAVRIERLRLRFPSSEKNARLPETAIGLSRYTFDALLVDRAIECGAMLRREAADLSTRPLVDATGRRPAKAPKGERLFGFKAHYDGPVNDAIELHFFANTYVGVNCIEGGGTNVCGIAPESLLKRCNFDYDAVLDASDAMRERLRPLTRSMDWLSVGPLEFGNRFGVEGEAGVYPAGDALSFVDPFTGTGLAGAVITGQLAGEAAARGEAVARYIERCQGSLKRPFAAASLFRAALRTRWAEAAASVVPADWLVRWTRPRRAA